MFVLFFNLTTSPGRKCFEFFGMGPVAWRIWVPGPEIHSIKSPWGGVGTSPMRQKSYFAWGCFLFDLLPAPLRLSLARRGFGRGHTRLLVFTTPTRPNAAKVAGGPSRRLSEDEA